MQKSAPIAFYDLDGTLVSSNVVTQYAFYARHHPAPLQAAARVGTVLATAPLLLALELYSRSAFNMFFYRYYKGLRRDWLERESARLFEEVFRPAIYRGARAVVEGDRSAGFRCVLVTGSLDFALPGVLEYFGFNEVICNRLVFRGGVSTGELEQPLIAGAEKVRQMHSLCRKHGVEMAACRAYSDSLSDLPMLEAVGQPFAANPGRRLRRLADQRNWPVLNLRSA